MKKVMLFIFTIALLFGASAFKSDTSPPRKETAKEVYVPVAQPSDFLTAPEIKLFKEAIERSERPNSAIVLSWDDVRVTKRDGKRIVYFKGVAADYCWPREPNSNCIWWLSSWGVPYQVCDPCGHCIDDDDGGK